MSCIKGSENMRLSDVAEVSTCAGDAVSLNFGSNMIPLALAG